MPGKTMTRIVSLDQKEHARAMLRRIRFARDDGKKKRADYLGRQYINSYDAKLMAVCKAYRKMQPHRRPDKAELPMIAKRIDPWKGTNEEVRVHCRPKSSNPDGYRVIMNFGI